MTAAAAARAAIVAVAVLAVLTPAALAAAPLPVEPRFRDRAVLGRLDAPMTVRFATDGQVLVAEKSGRVLRFSGLDDTTGDTVVDLRREVHDYWDRGLTGMALDPEFATNRRLYLLYTYDAPPGGTAPVWNDDCPEPPGALEAGCVASGRLVRVTLDAGGDPAKAQITSLIEAEWCQQFPSHSVGTVLFGPDGMLYAGGGEGAHFYKTDWGQFGGNPCGDPTNQGGALRSQDLRTTATGDPTGLDGTIVRVDPVTGAPALDAPLGADINARRIIAYGLRNPYRFTFRPGTEELWVADVGESKVEEINRIPDAGDGVRENFGWPCTEGNERLAAWTTASMCTSLTDSAMTRPYFAYCHGEPVSSVTKPCTAGGSSISGLAFHTAGTYPVAYEGALFFSDYSRNGIWVMRRGANGLPDPSTTKPFAAAPPGGGPVELQAGPGGDLFYVHFNPEAPAEGAVHRITYTGQAPNARLTATPSGGPAPLRVELDASGSTDPESQTLAYAWDLDGDGAYDDATGATIVRTFPTGDFPVRVRVTDSDGMSDTEGVTVFAGNTAPTVAIAAPVAGTTYAVGDLIRFSGSATDTQDGPLNASRLTWTVTIRHCPDSACHTHPLREIKGLSEGTFTAPDHEYPTRLELRLEAVDSRQVSSSVARELQPRTVDVRVETAPSGLGVRLQGGAAAPSPRTITVIEGASLGVGVDPIQRLAGEDWKLRGWNDGATDAERVLRVEDPTVLRATYAPPPAVPVPVGISEPPPLVLVPDTAGPRLRVTARLRQKLAAHAALRVACEDEPCGVAATATVRSGGRTRALAPVARQLATGKAATLSLRLRPALTAARRALARGQRVRLRVVVAATDAAGNLTRRGVTITLRR
jgi:glucose/arabinose dehydrogenase